MREETEKKPRSPKTATPTPLDALSAGEQSKPTKYAQIAPHTDIESSWRIENTWAHSVLQWTIPPSVRGDALDDSVHERNAMIAGIIGGSTLKYIITGGEEGEKEGTGEEGEDILLLDLLAVAVAALGETLLLLPALKPLLHLQA